ncbi:MAG: flagellar basal body rod protein FlgB [Rubrivivax sp.]
MITRLSDGLDFQAQALNLRSERQRLLSSNIANADTPGYHARDLDFASALREATGQAAPAMAGAAVLAALRQGNPAFGSATAGSVETHLRYAAPSQSNLDGNTVEEMVNMISASRSYQNNLEVMNTAKSLLMKTLQMGQS